MTDKRERSSGIDLLRMICMLLIVAHHYSVHGGFETGQLLAFRWQGLFVQFLAMFGRAACSIFMLISGFFLIERGRERHYRRVVPLAAELFFYSVTILAAVCLFKLRPVSLPDVIHALFPVIWGNWYVVAYLMVYMLVPFLNPLLLALDKKKYQGLLLTVFILWSVIPTFTGMDWEFSNLDYLLIMYLAGAYIRLHVDGEVRYKNSWNLLVSLGSAVLLLLSAAALNVLGGYLNSEYIVKNATYFHAPESVLAVVFAISTFLYFSRLKFSARAVNDLAGSMIGIYLIHDSNLLRGWLWTELSPNAAHLGTVWVHAPVKILAVFAVCLAIDLLRRATVERVFLRYWNKACAAWDKKHGAMTKE